MRPGAGYRFSVTAEGSTTRAGHGPLEGGGRRIAAIVLALLFVGVLTVANPALWFATSLSSTDVFVDTFAPLPSDQRVAAALAARFTESALDNTDIVSAVADPLPEGLEFIAGPLAEGARDLVAATAQSVISSTEFTEVWNRVLRTAHRSALWVVDKGDESVVSEEQGALVLELSELLVAVDARLERLSFGVLAGKATGASVVIYHSDGTGLVPTLVRAINAIRWIAPILTVVIAVAAFAVALDRRRMALWLGAGAATGMLVTLVALRWVQEAVVTGVADPVQRDGLAAAWGIVFDRFVFQTVAILLLGAVVTFVAWLLGSSREAMAMRRAFTRSSLDEDPVDGWINHNARALQVVTMVLGFAFLLLSPTTGLLTVTVTAVIVAIVVVVLQRFATT